MTWQERLDTVLRSWEGTPWIAGQQMKGRGVDCVRFVVGVLDELHGITAAPIPRLPQDMSLHDRSGAMRTALAIAGRYPSRVLLKTESIEPGDVVVIRTGKQGGPGHVLIAGSFRNYLWHSSSGVGVTRTGIGAMKATSIVKIWRPTTRESWSK